MPNQKNRCSYKLTVRRRGMVWMDTLVGLTLIVAMVGALAAAQSQQRKTSKAMSDQRQAVRTLESQAGRLLAGQPIDVSEVEQSDAGRGWTRLIHTADEKQTELFIYLGADPTDNNEKDQP